MATREAPASSPRAPRGAIREDVGQGELAGRKAGSWQAEVTNAASSRCSECAFVSGGVSVEFGSTGNFSRGARWLCLLSWRRFGWLIWSGRPGWRRLSVGRTKARGSVLLAARAEVSRHARRVATALVAGIRVVAEREALLAPTVTRRLIETFLQDRPRAPAPPQALGELTERELEVFRLIARGLSNAEIADQLVVSGTTVKTHVARSCPSSHCATAFKPSSSLTRPGSSLPASRRPERAARNPLACAPRSDFGIRHRLGASTQVKAGQGGPEGPAASWTASPSAMRRSPSGQSGGPLSCSQPKTGSIRVRLLFSAIGLLELSGARAPTVGAAASP